MGRDHDPPIVVGSGELMVSTSSSFSYRIDGLPEDIGHAIASLRRIESDPFDGRLRSRLTVTTTDGLDLACGWTLPRVATSPGGRGWRFEGEFDALVFDEAGEFEPGALSVFCLPRDRWERDAVWRMMTTDGDGVPCERGFLVNGARVRVSLDAAMSLLSIWAPATTLFHPTMAENWLGEPLRILLGQPIYPRYVIRRSRDRSMNWVRPSPEWSQEPVAGSLWSGDRRAGDAAGFWEAYRKLLSFVATSRDPQGRPNFEANPLTELHLEVAGAAAASRWAWALTFASAIEGLVRILGLEGGPRGDLTDSAREHLETEVESLKKHVDAWPGDSMLAQSAVNAVGRALRMSAGQALRMLERDGAISVDERQAWEALRNRVVHGRLPSPYSSELGDRHLRDLAGLFRSLTWRILAQADPDADPKETAGDDVELKSPESP